MKKYIKYLQSNYYEGNPLVSNEEYDFLVQKYGEEGIGKGGNFEHLYRMYSLAKVYPGRGDKYPLPISSMVKTPKLDGAAISLVYLGCNLVQGNTRGDGKTSPTTFEPWKLQILGIPQNLPSAKPTQITGEVVTTKRVPNERNYASGALQLKDEATFRSRVEEGGLEFVAYGVQNRPDFSGIFDTYTEDMAWLHSKGFRVVLDSYSLFDDSPQDGWVYRLDSNKAFYEAGFTDKHPRGAFAEKEDEEGIPTILLEVVWATGKTGKVTPTAVFDEVVIDGAKISRATLNNAGYLEALGVEIGSTILVIRSGGIIPKIIGKI